jgi:caa(3)-type oxidase subunit IV
MSENHAEHHIIPIKLYIINAGVILVLMFATVAFAKVEALDFPGGVNGINLWIALVIAIMKTACIMSIFMGVWWNSPLVRLFATGAWVWLLIFFAFTISDAISPKAGLGTPTTEPLPGVMDYDVYMDGPGAEEETAIH